MDARFESDLGTQHATSRGLRWLPPPDESEGREHRDGCDEPGQARGSGPHLGRTGAPVVRMLEADAGLSGVPQALTRILGQATSDELTDTW